MLAGSWLGALSPTKADALKYMSPSKLPQQQTLPTQAAPQPFLPFSRLEKYTSPQSTLQHVGQSKLRKEQRNGAGGRARCHKT